MKNKSSIDNNIVQSEWFCSVCSTMHMGNCPLIKTSMTVSQPSIDTKDPCDRIYGNDNATTVREIDGVMCCVSCSRPLSEHKQQTLTALSSIDSIDNILDDFKSSLGISHNDAKQRLEAHIAAHYVPKAEAEEPTTLDSILFSLEWKATFEHMEIADRIRFKQQIEALIQEAVAKAEVSNPERTTIDEILLDKVHNCMGNNPKQCMDNIRAVGDMLGRHLLQAKIDELNMIKQGDFYSGNAEDDLFEIDNHIGRRLAQLTTHKEKS